MEFVTLFKNILNKDKPKKTNFLFLIGLIGIVLIFASSIFAPKDNNTKPTKENEQSEQEYILNLEKKLSTILKKTQGVGEVEIMITLESSTSYIYAQDEQNDTEIQNSQSQIQSQKSTYQNEHVIIENSGDEKPLVETSITPEIKGVAVVCSGGGDILVIKRVTDLISALLALPTNRICVTKMI